MKKLSLLSVALVTIGSIGSSNAADLPAATATQTPLPYLNWTGFYAGVNAGYGWGNNNVNFVGADPNFYSPTITFGAMPAGLRPDAHGFVGGAQAGYNFQSGPVVYGIETDIQYANIMGTASVGTAVPGFPTILTTAQNKVDWFGTLRPRLGVTVAPAFLIYGTGGLAYGHVASSASTLVTGPAGITCANNLFCSNGSASQTRAGWTAGAGAEYAFSGHWSAKVEYLYVDLGHETYNMPSTLAPAISGMLGTTAFHEYVVRGGLNYKF